MKRKLKIGVLVCMVVFLAACGGKNPAGTGSGKENNIAISTEKGEIPGENKNIEEVSEEIVSLEILIAEEVRDEWTDTYEKLCGVSWQEMILSEKSREEYPELFQVLEEKNKEEAQYYQEAIGSMLPDAKERFQEEYFTPFVSESSLSIQRGDDRIVSIREDFYEYTGGAHGMYGAMGRNYDPATGEVLLITDVLKEITGLPSMLEEKVREEYGDEYETYEPLQEYLEREYTPEKYNWTMGYQGITFYFIPYEIAPYAAGMFQVTLWFDEISELVKEEYMQMPKGGYVMALPMNGEIDLDLERGDSARDKLMVSHYYQSQEEQENGFQRLEIGRNDSKYQTTECYGYEFSPYLVCRTEQGKERYFLYVDGVLENDFHTLYIYDLNEDEISEKPPMPNAGFMGSWDEDAGEYGKYYQQVLLDPNSFSLESRIYLLGTWGGRKNYAVDSETGAPAAETEEYEISNNSSPLISKIPMEVLMLPNRTKTQLPSGTQFYILRTDGENYVECRLEDGRECRMEVEYVEMESQINGISEWDCFETLLYAG